MTTLVQSHPPRVRAATALRMALYLLLGVACGLILLKGEIASWFRIQEMMRFQSFHMFGFFLTAVAAATPTVWLLRRGQRPALDGTPITVAPKEWGSGARYLLGGVVFGLGWGLGSVCPGPIYALLGSGISVMLVPFVSALVGTWFYGLLRSRLPH